MTLLSALSKALQQLQIFCWCRCFTAQIKLSMEVKWNALQHTIIYSDVKYFHVNLLIIITFSCGIVLKVWQEHRRYHTKQALAKMIQKKNGSSLSTWKKAVNTHSNKHGVSDYTQLKCNNNIKFCLRKNNKKPQNERHIEWSFTTWLHVISFGVWFPSLAYILYYAMRTLIHDELHEACSAVHCIAVQCTAVQYLKI